MEKLINEIKELVLHPTQLFQRLKEEQTTQGEITKSLLVYITAIPAAAGFLGKVIIGQNIAFVRYYHVPFFSGLLWATLLFAFSILGIYAVAFIVNYLSPKFGGAHDDLAAFKLTVYSFMPLFVLGISSLIPALAGFHILGLYGVYLFYIGLPVLMQVPEEKALPFTVLLSLISIFSTLLVYRLAGLVIVDSVSML